MKVVLFASGVLAAVGEALSLAQSVHRETADLPMEGFDPLTLAQTSQARGADADQLREQAAKAMDKDDKKKMGEETFNMFRRVRKKLEGKNADSKKLAQNIEDILGGKKEEEKKKEEKKDEKPKAPATPVSKPGRDKKQDEADNK